jgi:hypothetical protein
MFSVFGRLKSEESNIFKNIFLGVKSCFFLEFLLASNLTLLYDSYLTQGSCDLLCFFLGVKFHPKCEKNTNKREYSVNKNKFGWRRPKI